MKIVKKIFYIIAILIMLLCAAVVVFAFQPEWTKELSHRLYGQGGLAEKLEQLDNVFGGSDDVTQPGTLVDVQGLGIHVGTQEGIDWENLPTDSYELVDTQTLNLPENVLGKSDSAQITEEAKEVESAEQQLLEEALSHGELGDTLILSDEYHPYYAMLTDNMKKLYRQIYANALAINGSFAPAYKVHVSQLKTVFEAVYNDNPELFWVETGYSCKYTALGDVIEITIKYNETASRLNEERRRFDDAIEDILVETRKYSSPEEKEQCVHDMLSQKVEYNANAAMNQSAYSALVNHQSVCAGYARAFQYIMNILEIPTAYCTGYSDGNHAWNIVKLPDRYTNVDVTWDDTDPTSHDYFNKSDRDYSATHVRTGLSVYLPACRDYQEENKPLTVENEEHEKPLEYIDPIVVTEEEDDKEETEEDRLAAAGLTKEQVVYNLEDYYNACLVKTKNAGFGSHTFEIVIPVSFYPEIEKIYLDESYKKGYADAALKALGAEQFAVGMQVARWNGANYYKLFHNIAVW